MIIVRRFENFYCHLWIVILDTREEFCFETKKKINLCELFSWKVIFLSTTPRIFPDEERLDDDVHRIRKNLLPFNKTGWLFETILHKQSLRRSAKYSMELSQQIFVSFLLLPCDNWLLPDWTVWLIRWWKWNVFYFLF